VIDLDGYLPLICPAVAALAARPLAEHVPPRTASWLITVLTAGLALSSLVTLFALAAGDVLASVGLAAGVAGAAYAVFGQVRALRAARCRARTLPGAGTLAVVADDRMVAFAVPGRVVVSAGLLATLEPAERRVLLAHETAHLTGRHHVFRAVVRVASAANPLLWPARRALWYATERWADEEAAIVAGDRAMAARVIGKVALANARDPRPAGVEMGIGGRRPGPVPRRVAALLRPPPRPRTGLVAASLGLLLCSVLSTQDLVGDLSEHAAGRGVVVAAVTHSRRPAAGSGADEPHECVEVGDGFGGEGHGRDQHGQGDQGGQCA
jgi:hypothetical protein